MSKFSKRRLDPRECWGLSELREYPSCLGEMLNRERAPFFGLVQEAKDHLRTAYVLTGAIE
ncbi:MAG: hypothetical protein ACLPXW_01605, partial [Xanthobacteraceae bacterium]